MESWTSIDTPELNQSPKQAELIDRFRTQDLKLNIDNIKVLEGTGLMLEPVANTLEMLKLDPEAEAEEARNHITALIKMIINPITPDSKRREYAKLIQAEVDQS